MRPFGVVKASPLFDQHLGFTQCVEDLAVQALVPELAVEALVVAVLPGRAWGDEQGANVQPVEPGPDRQCKQLGAIGGVSTR